MHAIFVFSFLCLFLAIYLFVLMSFSVDLSVCSFFRFGPGSHITNNMV